MLSCADFLAEFGDYLEQVASPDVRAHLEEHLQECRTCRVIVDSTRKTIQIITDSECFTLPGDDVEPLVREVMARLKKRVAK